ncbi:MAG TPA: hypothetical protein VHZ25_05025 [Acidobacteriaceae bacterium]|jgi:hypothetical protein|nr:hypothetical protein [Acidobacteriaceae bacterium]
MTLSFTLRLFCLLLVVLGLVCATAQTLFSLAAHSLLRRLERVTARQSECTLYLIQIAPLLLAIVVAGALCLPAYLRYEPTRETEPVSWLCLLIAAVVTFWFGSAALRGVVIVFRTLRFIRACRSSGHIVRISGDASPLLALAEANPPVGLIGFLRPLILVSTDLLGTGGLHTDALEVALDHERSHAAHLDNWKQLFLSFLPQLPFDPWLRHWQKAADWAADDDAVRGDSSRSLLLAEALVRTARAIQIRRPSVICAALTSAEAGLAVRVDRLLHPHRSSRPADAFLHLGLAALVLLFAAATVIAFPGLMYSFFEHILHLGSV